MLYKSLEIIFTKVSFILVIVAGCEKNYFQLEPGSITNGNVTFTSRNGYSKTTYFTVSAPKKFSPNNDLPMLIALHHNGSDARSFHEFLLPIADSLGYLLLVPQGEDWIENANGWNWGRNSQKAILTCFNVLRKNIRIDPQRIFLCGFGEGGRIASELCLNYPYLFKGIALLYASLYQCLPEWKDNKKVKNLRLYVGFGPSDWHSWDEPIVMENMLRQSVLVVKFVPYEEIGYNFTKLNKSQVAEGLTFLDQN